MLSYRWERKEEENIKYDILRAANSRLLFFKINAFHKEQFN